MYRSSPAFTLSSLLGLAACMSTAPLLAQETRDPQIEALISKMTIEEKAGQLTILADETRNLAEGVNPEFRKNQVDALVKEIRKGHIGALFNGHGVAAGRTTQRIAA